MRAENLYERFSRYGELLIEPFASAPFPHPARAQGHQHKQRHYPADQHYSDNRVAIFIPKGFRERGQTDFVIHFHGWRNTLETVFQQYQLIEQFAASRRNAILVVPQGPFDASDSFGGKLEDAGGFERFMREVMHALSRMGRSVEFGRLILTGHSGGYRVIAFILKHGGLTDSVQEVWLFDALYHQMEEYAAWIDRYRRRLVLLYTTRGGTTEETGKLLVELKKKGMPLLERSENEVTPAELRQHNLVFLRSELDHNEVVHQRQAFREFLNVSCLAEISKTNTLAEEY